MRQLVMALFVVVFASPAFAQTQVPANQPFTATWDANPASENVTAYRCYVNKVKVGADIPASAPRVCVVPAQPAGSHTVEVSAVTSFGEGARAALTVTAGTAPGAPTNLRIVVQVAVQSDGSVTLLAAGVSKE